MVQKCTIVLSVGTALIIATNVAAQNGRATNPKFRKVFNVCSEKYRPPCATAPHAFYTPDPDYSKEAKKKKIEGTVVLWVLVGPAGRVDDVRIARTLGYGLDEEAIKAVSKWKFEPGTSGGVPVPVQINVEVHFRLY